MKRMGQGALLPEHEPLLQRRRRRGIQLGFPAAACLLALLSAGCEPDLCERLDEHLGSCNLRARVDYCSSEQWTCYGRCYLDASCRDIYDESFELNTCLFLCSEPVSCDDGETQISQGWVCDGEVDCLDGSDEGGCESQR